MPAEIATHPVLSPDDLLLARAKRRGMEHFYFAIPLCLLRHPGRERDTGQQPPLASKRRIGSECVGMSGSTSAPNWDRLAHGIAFALSIHVTQMRKGTDTPYISHLLAVTAIVLEYGGDEEQAIAAMVHDAIEDQGAHQEPAIAAQFGPRGRPYRPWLYRRRHGAEAALARSEAGLPRSPRRRGAGRAAGVSGGQTAQRARDLLGPDAAWPCRVRSVQGRPGRDALVLLGVGRSV